MRGVFFDEDHARQVVARLLRDGFEASCDRQPFAGEDDDADHPWVVQTDAPAVMLGCWSISTTAGWSLTSRHHRQLP